MEKPYLSLEEVADLLSVHYQLIYRLVRSGEMPAIKLGRVYRIDRNDLQEYLASTKTHSGRRGGTCSSCGKTYASKNSLAEGCTECDAPICRDCWTRKGVRTCGKHS